MAQTTSGVLGVHTHLHLHAEMVRWEPDEGAVERDRMVRIAHDRNGDKADVADVAARGIEIDPADARQILFRHKRFISRQMVSFTLQRNPPIAII